MHDLKSASLACRQFHNFASVYLFQTVRIQLTAAPSSSPKQDEDVAVSRHLRLSDLSNCRKHIRNAAVSLLLEPAELSDTGFMFNTQFGATPELTDIGFEFNTQFRAALGGFLQSLPRLRNIQYVLILSGSIYLKS
jgi:hypothetical protein